jgi:hypothetical protein
MIPDLCSTGILSSNDSPGFNQLPASGDRVETLYRGRLDITAKWCIVNV